MRKTQDKAARVATIAKLIERHAMAWAFVGGSDSLYDRRIYSKLAEQVSEKLKRELGA
jgi:hypothetical protein